MRLIDADALLARMRECERPYREDDGRSIWATGWAWSFIENAPTVKQSGDGHWIAPKVWHEGYVDKHINGWKRGVDNDYEMLECPRCKCRVFAEQYIHSVGAQGFNFCPYCGEDLRPDQMTMEELL